MLTDAGIIANYSESWSESMGYFNQAIKLFEENEQEELAANVHYRKGTLLYTWAKNGNGQFYRSAAESYQQAARTFTRQHAPEVYAEIQHHLGAALRLGGATQPLSSDGERRHQHDEGR